MVRCHFTIWLGWVVRRSVLVALAVLFAGFLGACSTGAYFWQATTGHLKVLASAKPIDAVLATPDTPAKLRTQLKYVQQIRAFSVTRLGLPDNRSYRSYADLNRPYVVWNVVAAQPDSLTLNTWCFPFTGCISYKGFYKEEDAVKLGNSLRSEGLDVAVLGVPAYSTLGFTPDPVLSTFVYFPAGELARLIFHELAHQVIYIADDTMFNESFATAVEELGVNEWLNQEGNAPLRAPYEVFDGRRAAFRLMLARAQDDLRAIYSDPALVESGTVLQAKAERLALLRTEYSGLKASWGGWAGYDRFMADDLNNAKLGVSGLYTRHVPAFKALFVHCESNFPDFYKAVDALGAKPAAERDGLLQAIRSGDFSQIDLGCSGF